MTEEKYILRYEGECDRLEAQSLIFGHDRGLRLVDPKPGTRLLDAGCGSGWLSRLVARTNPDCQVFGVDINPDYVAYATSKADEAGLSNLAYQTGSVTDLPFEDGSFDTVWSLMVLLFLPDRAGAIAEMARITAPNGRLKALQQGGLLQQNHPPDADLEPHIRAFIARAFPDYDVTALPGMMRDAGLENIIVGMETDPLYTFLGAASDAQIENHRNVSRPAVDRMGDFLNDPDASASFPERWSAYIARPDTTTLTTFCAVEGVKPAR